MGSRRNQYYDSDSWSSDDDSPPRRNYGRGNSTKVPDRYRTVEGIASYYEKAYPTYDVGGRRNPVESTTLRKVPGRTELPLVVRSTITGDTLRPANSRERFDARINRHVGDMQAGYNDDRGHIVASKLGGPNDVYNVIPQHRSLNRHGRNPSDWRYLEQDMETFMEENPGGRIERTDVMLYENRNRPNRPSEIGTSLRLYNDRGQQVDFDGRRVTKRSNEFENSFFKN